MTKLAPEGDLLQIDLLSEIAELSSEGFSGALRLEKSDAIRILYFRNGDLLSASTNDPAASIESILLEAERLSREHLDEAVARVSASESLGEILLSLGFISKKELRWARRVQLVRVLTDALGWDHGKYALVPDYVPSRSEGTIYPTAQIILEAVFATSNRQRFERETGIREKVFVLDDDFDDRYKLLGLNEDADKVVGRIDGQRDAATIIAEAPGDPFLNLKLLHGLSILGLVREKPEPDTFEQQPLFFGETEEETSPETGEGSSTPSSTEFLPSIDLGLGAGSSTLAEEEPLLFDDDEEGPYGETPTGHEDDSEPLGDESVPAREPLDEAAIAELVARDEAEMYSEEEVEVKPRRGMIRALIAGLLLAGLVVAAWALLRGKGSAPDSEEARAEVPVVAESESPVLTDESVVGELPPPEPDRQPPVTNEESPAPTESVEPGRAERVEEKTDQNPGPAVVSRSGDELRALYDREAVGSRNRLSEVAYTVQFEIVCETASVTLAKDLGGDSVWFIPISFRGRDCFRVFWGRYADPASAREAIAEIPARLRADGTPVVIDVQEVFF